MFQCHDLFVNSFEKLGVVFVLCEFDSKQVFIVFEILACGDIVGIVDVVLVDVVVIYIYTVFLTSVVLKSVF